MGEGVPHCSVTALIFFQFFAVINVINMPKRAKEKHNFGRCSSCIQRLTKINIRGATDSHLAWTLIVTDGTLLHTVQKYYDRYSLCAGFFLVVLCQKVRIHALDMLFCWITEIDFCLFSTRSNE